MKFRQIDVDFETPKVMGILNVTPDSFSDGGKFNQIDLAIKQTQCMIEAGATFIDVGGESTRPGAEPVSVDVELERVIPVIEAITKELDVLVSVDTNKALVMREAVNAGASMINDVRALQNEGALDAAVWAAQTYNVPSCIMHMKGQPETMQDAPQYGHVVEEVMDFFEQRVKACSLAGLTYDQIIIDPGFGFGKTLDHNYQLLKYLQNFNQFDLPVLAGLSRKSMIGKLLGRDVEQRLAGSVATATIAALAGASIIRVHDVEETMDAVNIVNKLQNVE